MALLALGTALLMQSCSKDADKVVPSVRTNKADAQIEGYNVQVNIYQSGAGLNSGATVDMSWYDPEQEDSGVTESSAAFRVEFYNSTGLVLVAPHVESDIAINGPSGSFRNGFTFSIPSYLPAGTYEVRVSPDVPNGSLVAYQTTPSPDGQGHVTITQGPVSSAANKITAAAGPYDGSFTARYSSGLSYFGYNKIIRLGLQNTATGVFFLLAPPSADWPLAATSTTNNRFQTPMDGSSIPSFSASYSSADIGPTSISNASGTAYKLFLDDYNTTYISGATVYLN